MDPIYKITFAGIAITSAIALISARMIIAAEDIVIDTDTARIENFSAASIKDATIKDEGEMYSGERWLKPDGTVSHPEWFEGDKLINADGTYYLIKAEEPPGYYTDGGDFDNYVVIGDEEDEAENKLEYVNGSEVSVREVGGREYTSRTLGKNGAMVVNLSCSPDETNYLTVRLWGGDTGDGMLWVCDPVSGTMSQNGTEQPHRNGQVDRRDRVELNTLSSTPQYEGGFIYTTYEIPKIYTEGRTSVSLRIYSTGGPADYGSTVIKDQTEQSRGIYGVFMEQEGYFEPERYGITGGGYSGEGTAANVPYDETKEQLKNAVINGIETLRSWQIYGDGNYPSYMEGMITRSTAWQTKSAEDGDWKDAYYSDSYMLRQNLAPLDLLSLAAHAYKSADTLGLDEATKAELLDRVIAGVDFLCRAQGSNGGFFSADGWIGGPDRREASGSNLTGFGLRRVGEALLTVWDDIDEETKHEMIDADADGIPDSGRITAWNDMLKAARDHLITLDGGYGHAPNQDMANSEAALSFDALLAKSGGETLSDGRRNTVLGICFGNIKNPVLSSYWVSEKGTILENFGSVQGGYSGDYGSNAVVQLSRIARIAQEHYGLDYSSRIDTVYDAIDNYYFTGIKTVNGENRMQLYTEGLTSNRNLYYPGTERYPIDIYAALELENDTALRIIYDYLSHKDIAYETENDTLNASNAHYEENILDAFELFDAFDRLTAAFEDRDIEDHRYVMEDESIDTYAWYDVTARSVVIKDRGERIYMSLNWRNPMHTENYYNTSFVTDEQRIKINNIARVHAVNGRYDRYGYAGMYTDAYSETDWTYINKYGENSCIQALMICRYGDYTVLMNSRGCEGGTARSYSWSEFEEHAALDRDAEYTDLVTGKVYRYSGGQWESGGTVMRLDARSAMVLKKSGITAYGAYAGKDAAEITVRNSTDAAVNVTVYAAEKDDNGILTDIGVSGFSAEPGTSRLYVPVSETAELFVWDDKMVPLCIDKRE